jgi:hypothetical protein
MNFTPEEINFIMSAMQNMSTKQESFFQQQCNCDSRKLYAKLFDTWETLELQNAN